MKTRILLLALLCLLSAAVFSQTHTNDCKCWRSPGNAKCESVCPGCEAEYKAKQDEANRKEKAKQDAAKARYEAIVKERKAARQRADAEAEQAKKDGYNVQIIPMDVDQYGAKWYKVSKTRTTVFVLDAKGGSNKGSEGKKTNGEQGNSTSSTKDKPSSSSSSGTASSDKKSSDKKNSSSSSSSSTESWKVKGSLDYYYRAEILYREGVVEASIQKLYQARYLLQQSLNLIYSSFTAALLQRVENAITGQSIAQITHFMFAEAWKLPWYLQYGKFLDDTSGYGNICQVTFFQGFDNVKGTHLNWDFNAFFGSYPEAHYVEKFTPDNSNAAYYSTSGTGRIKLITLSVGARLDTWIARCINPYLKVGVGAAMGIADDAHSHLQMINIVPVSQAGIGIKLGKVSLNGGLGYTAYPLKVSSDNSGNHYNDVLKKNGTYEIQHFVEKNTGGLFWFAGVGISFGD